MIKVHEISVESAYDQSLAITDLQKLADGVYLIHIANSDKWAMLNII